MHVPRRRASFPAIFRVHVLDTAQCTVPVSQAYRTVVTTLSQVAWATCRNNTRYARAAACMILTR